MKYHRPVDFLVLRTECICLFISFNILPFPPMRIQSGLYHYPLPTTNTQWGRLDWVCITGPSSCSKVPQQHEDPILGLPDSSPTTAPHELLNKLLPISFLILFRTSFWDNKKEVKLCSGTRARFIIIVLLNSAFLLEQPQCGLQTNKSGLQTIFYCLHPAFVLCGDPNQLTVRKAKQMGERWGFWLLSRSLSPPSLSASRGETDSAGFCMVGDSQLEGSSPDLPLATQMQ